MIPKFVEKDAITDAITIRDYTPEEMAVYNQSLLDSETYLADQQAKVDAKVAGIAHALSLGFNQAQAEALFP